MFGINDTIMYGSYGVCRIVDIRPEQFSLETRVYYVLKPVQDETSTIYCPVEGGEKKFRHLLSVNEIYELVASIPKMEAEWIEDDQQRQEKFQDILRHGDHASLMKLVKTLYTQREKQRSAGKKFHNADQKLMKEAEGVLYSEFAHVLHIRPDEVVPFIAGRLKKGSETAS